MKATELPVQARRDLDSVPLAGGRQGEWTPGPDSISESGQDDNGGSKTPHRLLEAKTPSERTLSWI